MLQGKVDLGALVGGGLAELAINIVSALLILGIISLSILRVTKSLRSMLMTGYLLRCSSNDGSPAICRSAKSGRESHERS